jgi:hypothetical protein
MESLKELIEPLISLASQWLPYAAGALLIIMLVVRGSIVAMVRFGQRWAGYEEGHRFFQPRSWFKIEPKKHFEVKGKILANEEMRKLYAPEARYTRDLRDKERAWKLAFLSPFPAAVKAAVRDGDTPKGKKLDARKLVATAARRIEVCSLPEGIYVSGDLSKHYQIKLATVGKDPAVIERVENNLLTQLNLRGGIRRIVSDDPTTLCYEAHEEKVIDPLTETKIGVDWLDEHKATSPYALPLAIKRDGQPLVYNMHHGMCGGASGTGKGSFFQALIWQLADQVEKGVVELWFIDPKWSESKLYERNPSSLFKHISVGMDEDAMRLHAETIHKLKMLISRRIAKDNTSIEEGKVEDGRDFDASKEDPMVVLFIDEYPTLYNGFNILGKEGKIPQAELDQIVATGRSLGVFVEAATQKFSKTILEAVRDNIANWWILGQDSAYYNDLFLGEGAREAGYDSTAIPRSSKADGYSTAGIGFAKDESGAPVAFRLPFVSKEDMGALIRRFQASDGKRPRSNQTPVVTGGSDDYRRDERLAITDEDDDYPEELPSLELISFDEELPPLR